MIRKRNRRSSAVEIRAGLARLRIYSLEGPSK